MAYGGQGESPEMAKSEEKREYDSKTRTSEWSPRLRYQEEIVGSSTLGNPVGKYFFKQTVWGLKAEKPFQEIVTGVLNPFSLFIHRLQPKEYSSK